MFSEMSLVSHDGPAEPPPAPEAVDDELDGLSFGLGGDLGAGSKPWDGAVGGAFRDDAAGAAVAAESAAAAHADATAAEGPPETTAPDAPAGRWGDGVACAFGVDGDSLLGEMDDEVGDASGGRDFGAEMDAAGEAMALRARARNTATTTAIAATIPAAK